jgi:hypothetical protein
MVWLLASGDTTMIGHGFTRILNVSTQSPNLYIIIAVPTDTPVTIPVVGPIVAIATLELDQSPPRESLVNVMFSPTPRMRLPSIFAG